MLRRKATSRIIRVLLKLNELIIIIKMRLKKMKIIWTVINWAPWNKLANRSGLIIIHQLKTRKKNRSINHYMSHSWSSNKPARQVKISSKRIKRRMLRDSFQ